MNRGEFLERMQQLIRDLNYNAGMGYTTEEKWKEEREKIMDKIDVLVVKRAEKLNDN